MPFMLAFVIGAFLIHNWVYIFWEFILMTMLTFFCSEDFQPKMLFSSEMLAFSRLYFYSLDIIVFHNFYSLMRNLIVHLPIYPNIALADI